MKDPHDAMGGKARYMSLFRDIVMTMIYIQLEGSVEGILRYLNAVLMRSVSACCY